MTPHSSFSLGIEATSPTHIYDICTFNQDCASNIKGWWIWSNKNARSLPLRMQSSRATLENSLGVSYKAKHRLPVRSRYLLKYTKSLCPHKPAYEYLQQLYQQLPVSGWINCGIPCN